MKHIEQIDHNLLLMLNGWGPIEMDFVMVWASDKYIWIVLYILIIIFLYYKLRQRIWLAMLAILITFTLTDLLSVNAFKEVFQRYRPCHHLELKESIRLVSGRCGGLYGFVSSHAANTMGLFSVLVFSGMVRFVGRKLWEHLLAWLLLFYVLLNCYSRIYLGVHYPSDVIGGVMLGALIGWMVSRGLVWGLQFIDKRRR